MSINLKKIQKLKLQLFWNRGNKTMLCHERKNVKTTKRHFINIVKTTTSNTFSKIFFLRHFFYPVKFI